MVNANFSSSLTASISPGEAIKRISNIPGWWGVSFSGSSEKKNDRFVVKMSGESFFDFTVEELIPGKRVVWLITDCYMPWFSDKKEWANTKLIFDLFENNGVTTVQFTHNGLTPDLECYHACETGWTHWIRTSLLSFLTTGKGMFKQTSTKIYSVEMEIAKSPHDVFNHLIDLRKWWPEEFVGDNIRLNSEFVFRTGESHISKNKVIEFVPDKKLVWFTTESIRKSDNFDWTGTKFIFELTPQDNNTLLKFTYDGVVPENEYDKLVQICDLTVKEMFYNFVTDGKLLHA